MRIFFVSLFVIVGAMSCTPYPLSKKSVVRFQLPTSSKNISARNILNTTGTNGVSSISSLDEINCYGITVGWNNSAGSCLSETNSAVVYANEIYGFYPEGSFVEIEVTAGDNRTFKIIGLASVNGACPDFIRFPLAARAQSSSPYLVGSKTVKVPEGDMDLSIDISMLGSTKIADCKKPPFLWEGGGQGKWNIARWDQATFGP